MPARSTHFKMHQSSRTFVPVFHRLEDKAFRKKMMRYLQSCNTDYKYLQQV